MWKKKCGIAGVTIKKVLLLNWILNNPLLLLTLVSISTLVWNEISIEIMKKQLLTENFDQCQD
jgi:hypothetical protein